MIEKLEQRLQELTKHIEEAKNLRLLAASPEWKSLAAAIEQSMVAKVNKVCSVDCSELETTVLRAELRVLRWFLKLPKIPDAEFEKTTRALRDLRQKVDRLHTVGQVDRVQAAAVAEEADDLARSIERMP